MTTNKNSKTRLMNTNIWNQVLSSTLNLLLHSVFIVQFEKVQLPNWAVSRYTFERVNIAISDKGGGQVFIQNIAQDYLAAREVIG